MVEQSVSGAVSWVWRFPLLTAAILFALAAATVCAQTPAPTQTELSVRSGIVYAQGAVGPLLADAYIPAGKGPFPGILFIHGGGWINGDRNQMVKLIRTLAERGYVGFTIDYDVAPVTYPKSFQESLLALEYFRGHAKELHLDPARVAVAGSSAGGELAALVALNPGGVTMPGIVPVVATQPVQAAVILNGVLDLTAFGDKSNLVTGYLGGPCTSLTDACRDASPQYHVHAGAPPFYVGHGTADQTVPFAQAEAFVAALNAVKVPAKLFTATGGPHTYWIKPEFYTKNLEAISSFLAEALGSRKPSVHR